MLIQPLQEIHLALLVSPLFQRFTRSGSEIKGRHNEKYSIDVSFNTEVMES